MNIFLNSSNSNSFVKKYANKKTSETLKYDPKLSLFKIPILMTKREKPYANNPRKKSLIDIVLFIAIIIEGTINTIPIAAIH